MQIHLETTRARVSGSQKAMIAALEKARWENDVCATLDPYTITTHFEFSEDKLWVLIIEREKREPLVSIANTEGNLFMFQEPEELFAFFLRIKLERLAKVNAELKLKALQRSQQNS
jgi:hypothetical protein